MPGIRAKKLLLVVGTRPNFIKITQFRRCAARFPGLQVKIVHTGQHHDAQMADVFFQQFGLIPDYFLNIGVGSPNTQMAKIMLALESTVEGFRPDLVMVVGDVNSTLAAALTAKKMGVPLAHLESGLRSNDKSMPEEINRILTDQITDYFFVTEQSGLDHLKAEGLEARHMHFVGNTMIDTMVAFEKEIASSDMLSHFGVPENGFCLMTIHRPATVDSPEGLKNLLSLIEAVRSLKIIFPVHPRTVANLIKFGLHERFTKIDRLIMCQPLDYFGFQKLIATCRFIITDSGGIQEESTFRQKPCLTLRANTERPVTVDLGTNTLLPFDNDLILTEISNIINGNYKTGSIPPLWDGRATERVIDIVAGI